MAIEMFIRFEDSSGTVRYGEISGAGEVADLPGAKVAVLAGDPFTGLSKTGEKFEVKKVGILCLACVNSSHKICADRMWCQVLCPLESTPIIICIGLNYRQHATEANVSAGSSLST